MNGRRTRISDLIVAWTGTRAHEVSPATMAYVRLLSRRWSGMWGMLAAEDLSVMHVIGHMRAREGVSASAWNFERAQLRLFLGFVGEVAGGEGASLLRPWKRRRVVVKKTYCPPTVEEEAAIVDAAPPWLGRYVTVAVRTGLRERTLRELVWDDVVGDPVSSLDIPAEKLKAHRALKVPVSEIVAEALGARGEGAVFPGLPAPPALWRAFKRTVRVVLVPERAALMNIHDLRRGFVERLMQAGASTLAIMALGGWNTQSPLIAHYARAIGNESYRELVNSVPRNQ